MSISEVSEKYQLPKHFIKQLMPYEWKRSNLFKIKNEKKNYQIFKNSFTSDMKPLATSDSKKPALTGSIKEEESYPALAPSVGLSIYILLSLVFCCSDQPFPSGQ